MVAALAAAIAISGLPQNAVVEATGPSGAPYAYAQPTATEGGRTVPVTCAPSSGSTFALGRTTVTCSAVDAGGNRSAATFDVTVQDTTPPVLHLPRPITVDATSPRGARVAWAVHAVDAVDGAAHVSCSDTSGERFPIGTTPVMCVANDSRGNDSLATFVITVRGAAAVIHEAIAGAPARDARSLRAVANALRRGTAAACVRARGYGGLVRAHPRLEAAARRIEAVLGCAARRS
jgi:hypothetical protein